MSAKRGIIHQQKLRMHGDVLIYCVPSCYRVEGLQTSAVDVFSRNGHLWNLGSSSGFAWTLSNRKHQNIDGPSHFFHETWEKSPLFDLFDRGLPSPSRSQKLPLGWAGVRVDAKDGAQRKEAAAAAAFSPHRWGQGSGGQLRGAMNYGGSSIKTYIHT